MAYSRFNPNWDRMMRARDIMRIAKESSLAAAIQQACPELSHDQAELEAARIAAKQTAKGNPT